LSTLDTRPRCPRSGPEAEPIDLARRSAAENGEMHPVATVLLLLPCPVSLSDASAAGPFALRSVRTPPPRSARLHALSTHGSLRVAHACARPSGPLGSSRCRSHRIGAIGFQPVPQPSQTAKTRSRTARAPNGRAEKYAPRFSSGAEKCAPRSASGAAPPLQTRIVFALPPLIAFSRGFRPVTRTF
jgi:hypothetical protein